MQRCRNLLLVSIYIIQLNSVVTHEEEPMKCYFLKLTASKKFNEEDREPHNVSVKSIAKLLIENNGFNPSVTCSSNSSIVFYNKTFIKNQNNEIRSHEKFSTMKIWYKVSGNGISENGVLEAYECKENAFHRTIEKYTTIQDILKFQQQNEVLPSLIVDSQSCCDDTMAPCCNRGYKYSTEQDKCFQQSTSSVITDNKKTVSLADKCHPLAKCGVSIGVWIIISSGSFMVFVAVILASYYIYNNRTKQELTTEIIETSRSIEIQTEEAKDDNITTADVSAQFPTPQLPTARTSISNTSNISYMDMKRTSTSSSSTTTDRPMSRPEISFDFNKHIPIEKIKFTGTKLGQGQFGQVELVEADIDGKMVECAAKMIRGRGTSEDERELFDELQTLYSIPSHDNVLGLLGACIDDKCPLYVLVEYCPKGDLLKYLQKHTKNNEYMNTNLPILNLRWKLKRAVEICNGMMFLDKNKIIHRDLAARNILLDTDEKAKISDFGMAKDVYLRGLYIKQTSGFLPIRWMAIESIESNIYTIKSDMWSFGILLWELYMDGMKLPYPNVSNGTKLLDHLQEGNRMNQPENCPDKFYELMNTCWLKNPRDRPQFVQVKRKLEEIMTEETRKESASSNESNDSENRSTKFDHNHSFDNSGRTNSRGDLELQTIVESSPPDHNTKL